MQRPVSIPSSPFTTPPAPSTASIVSPGVPVRQQGLLQLTYDDSQRYQCNFNWQHDRRLPEKDPARTILQPANNLRCGVRILENQIIRRHKPLVTRSSYWSTLQPGTSSYAVFAKQMANVPVACGIGALKPRRPSR